MEKEQLRGLVMVGKPQGKRAITRPRRRCVSKINMHVKGTWWWA